MKSFIFKKILNGLMCLVTLFGLFCFMSCAADAGSGSGGGNTDKLVLDFNGGKMYNHKLVTFTVEEITPYVGKTIDEAFKSLGIDTAFIKKEGFYLQGWTLKKNAEICVQNLPSYGTLYAKWGTDPLGGKDNSDEQDKTDDPIIPNDPAFDPDTPNPQPIVVVFDFDGGTHDGKLLFNLDFDYQLMQEYRGKPINEFLEHYGFKKSLMQKKGYIFNGWTLSQDGEDYVTVMPYSGAIKYWAKWIPENPSKPSDPSNPTPKPLYEYSVDNTQITFTFVPSDFGCDWGIKENHKVQVMIESCDWLEDEDFLMTKDKDGNYSLTIDYDYALYEDLKKYSGFNFYIYEDKTWLTIEDYKKELFEDEIIEDDFKIKILELSSTYLITFDLNGGHIDGDTSSFTSELSSGTWLDWLDIPAKEGYIFKGWTLTKDGDVFINYLDRPIPGGVLYAKWQDPLKLFESGDIVGDMSGDGLPLLYEGEGIYSITFTYSKEMDAWGGADFPNGNDNGDGTYACEFKMRTVAGSWDAPSYGSFEPLVVNGSEICCSSIIGGNIVVNLKDGFEYKIIFICEKSGEVWTKVTSEEDVRFEVTYGNRSGEAESIEVDLLYDDTVNIYLYSKYFDKLDVIDAYIMETKDELDIELGKVSSVKWNVQVKMKDFLDVISRPGKYTVVLSIACPGVINDKYELPVTVYVTSSVVAPSIETDLPSTANVGDTLTVVAKVTSGDINYQWYKDDCEILGATTTSYKITEKGYYYVKVSNALDSSKFVYSATTIATTLFSITEHPTDLVIADLSKNSSQFLTASAFVYEGETISAQWFKDGVAVSSIENATTSITSTYKPTEFGIYVCKFISEEETLTTYIVEVSEAPISQGLVIEGITEGMPVNVGEEIIITPKSDVPCTYTYQWWAHGEFSGGNIEIEGATSNTYTVTDLDYDNGYDEYGIFCVVTFTSMQTGATIKRETATARYAH